MKYKTPELTIEKFDLDKDIMAEGLSGNGNEGGGFDWGGWGNGGGDEHFFEDFSTAIRNILDI